MIRIKSYSEFKILNEISGAELVGPVGPAYGETRIKNKTLTGSHTHLNSSPDVRNKNSNNVLTSDLFFDDEWEQLLNDFLKSGGQLSEMTGDRKNDIKIVSDFLNNS
jgi:hypothetical protein